MEAYSPKEQQPIEGAPNKPPQNIVTCVHRANVAGLYRTVTLTWTKSVMKHTLFITIEDTCEEDNPYTVKIDVNTWQFWGRKGKKCIIVDAEHVDIFWDLRSAQFSSSPEPDSDYYVALVSDGKVVLLIGDQKKEAFKRVKSKSSALVDSRMLYKKENLTTKKCFDARTFLGKGEKERSIHIETSISDHDVPEMWIVINGIVMVHVANLHWRFRGNETVMVDDMAVKILWDVYDWLYKGSDSGQGMFIFSQGGDKCVLENGHSNGEICDGFCDECSKDFCHYIYAWKLEW